MSNLDGSPLTANDMEHVNEIIGLQKKSDEYRNKYDILVGKYDKVVETLKKINKGFGFVSNKWLVETVEQTLKDLGENNG